MIRRLKNASIILLSGVLIGVLLLCLVFCLPVKSARENVEASLYQMIDIKYDEDGDPERKEIIDLKENFTDYLMVQNALEKVEGKSPLAHAMYIYHYDLGEDSTWFTEESLVTLLRKGTEGMFLREYSKYWHGYLIFLKPLLMCMTWEHLETFMVVVQLLYLAVVVGISFYKRKQYVSGVLLCALAFMKPARIWLSFAMCVSWNITLTAVLVELLFYDKLEEKNWREEFFLIIGILTAYMDFLTYPIVTVGIPLCIYVVEKAKEEIPCLVRLKQVFWMGCSWVVGYIGMWGMKWVVAELTYRTGTLREAVWSVIYRTTPLDGYQSASSGIFRTWDSVLMQYQSAAYGVLFVLIAAAAILSVVICLIKARSMSWGISIICLGMIALLPFVWLVLTQNHTAIHCWFTFRIMGVSICALCGMTVCSVRSLWEKKRSVRETV